MQKSLLTPALTAFAVFSWNSLSAQTFTADLELQFADTTTHFILQPEEEIQVNFNVINHGPDDIDTNGVVIYGLNDMPFSFIVQSEDGDLMPINQGDTVYSRGVNFINTGDRESDTTTQWCYYLKVNEDFQEFIHDPNPLNDTICFFITYKGVPNAIAETEEQEQQLLISPNPARGQVSILPRRLPATEPAHISIYSVDGRIIYEERILSSYTKPVWVDVASWASGIYFVRLQSGGINTTAKFVVE